MLDIKRYQNPEIFEQLAIEYVVGALHGRARKRFEVLMETHFYLQATVEAYEHKFAHLVELLPEAQPSDQLWKNLDAHINANTQSTPLEKTPWWRLFFNAKSYGLLATAFILSAVMLFNPMTGSPVAYTAVLASNVTHTMMGITRISQADMKIIIDMVKEPDIPDNMHLALWCHPKGGGKAVMMGRIAKLGETVIRIDKAEWQNFKNVGLLTVSLESKDAKNGDTPSGKILLKGQLSSTHET
jgi:anti-sigma-K factor RskA